MAKNKTSAKSATARKSGAVEVTAKLVPPSKVPAPSTRSGTVSRTRSGMAALANTGSFTGFMMQRGRMVILGNAGKNLGDSMYDGTIYLGGEARSFGVDAVPGEMTDLDREWLTRKLKMYDLLPAKGIGHIKKIVAGKALWNYDNLEPGEKKMVL